MRSLSKKSLAFVLLVLSSRTAMTQWVQQPFPTSEALWRVRFVSASTGWIVGHNHVYKTTNAGITWERQDSSYGGAFASLALNENVMFYGNYNGIRFRGIRRTTDGGVSWQTVDPDTSFYCTDIKFTSSQTGFAVGGIITTPTIQVVHKTIDGGTTWFALSTRFAQARDELEAMTFIDAVRAWVVSYDGVVFRTTDGGDTWTYQDSVGYHVPGIAGWLPTRDIQFINQDSGWVAGGISGNNFVARTTTGGASWSYATPRGTSIREIRMLDSRVGWYAGPTIGGLLCRTTDGGASWSSQQLSPQPLGGFESMSIIDQLNGWAVGPSGLVYKTTNGGVVFAQEGKDYPTGFRLFQNYPNPFNPSTKISFTLPARTQPDRTVQAGTQAGGQVSGFTSLKIYDVLGREVATLVNEELGPGRHSVVWDAAAFVSGVYFYQLSSSNFVQTRKLMLIR